jgi:hypothetical protein
MSRIIHVDAVAGPYLFSAEYLISCLPMKDGSTEPRICQAYVGYKVYVKYGFADKTVPFAHFMDSINSQVEEKVGIVKETGGELSMYFFVKFVKGVKVSK